MQRIYPIISTHLASTSIQLQLIQNLNQPLISTFSPFSFSIVTRVKHDRVESDLEEKRASSPFSFDPTDRITEFTIGFYKSKAILDIVFN